MNFVRPTSLATKACALLLLVFVAAGCGGGGGSGSSSISTGTADESTSWVARWNRIATDAAGLDHVPGQAGHQLGPTRSSRAIAMVQIAVFDAVNAIAGGYRSYAANIQAAPGASMQAAVAQAAHDTLLALYPSQADHFAEKLASDLASIPDGPEKEEGIRVGREACQAILAIRQGDGSEAVLDHQFNPAPGFWSLDPFNPDQEPLGAEWKNVIPFAVSSASQFRSPPPPALDSPEYAAAFDEVKRLGGDGIQTPTERTVEQEIIGNYWAYDGTPSLCAPPRLYNQILLTIAEQQGTGTVELARLLALANVAMADAGVTSWESKYFYDFWRPVTAIPRADEDGNEATIADPTFKPLGAPASNTNAPNFTPPFPAYPSGHATFGGAMFQTLRNFYGTDNISFTFVSDEYNGSTVGNDGLVRPLIPRSFSTLSEAEEENGQSRIYLGIHFSFDKTAGIDMGRDIADFVFENNFQQLN